MAGKSVVSTKILPKVKFRVAPLDDYFSELHRFLNPDANHYDWSGGVLKKYPGLKDKLQSVTDVKEREKIEQGFFEEVEREELPKMEIAREEFQKAWDKIGDDLMRALSEILEIDWGENDRKITATLTLNPIMPRFPEQRMFRVFYGADAEHAIDTVIHESLHFLYFEKWSLIFPEIKADKTGKDNPAWKLSEIVTGVIPNDPRIQFIFKHEFHTYREFQNTNIDGKPLVSHIQRLYDEREDFADFLRKAWEFVKLHEKEIP